MAIKREKFIREEMKKRQIESGKAFGKGGKGYDQMVNTFEDKTSTRKELAKLANTLNYILTFCEDNNIIIIARAINGSEV